MLGVRIVIESLNKTRVKKNVFAYIDALGSIASIVKPLTAK